MKKGFTVYLFSIIGVLAMLVILIAINVIGGRVKQRIDLTAERAYTLSPGTREILKRLDTPVQIRFYWTRSDAQMPVFLKTHAQRVEDLLNEYRQASRGLIEVQRLDPAPDSDAEDSAKLDGIEPQGLLESDPLYLGLSVTMLDQKETIPFLSHDRERLLEYDISRAISRVMTPEKPVVGVMSPLPISGQQMNPMMMQMGRRGSPPWVLLSELQRDFTVQQIEMTVDKIPDNVRALVLIHPKAISETAEYAIDQFILRGGKLIAFLDPLSVLDPQASQMGGMGFGAQSSSTIDRLLTAWGLRFDTTRVVADMDYVARTRQGRAPAALALTERAVNKDDVITANIDSLFYVFGGAFSGAPVEGLTQTVLLESSKNSQLVDPMSAQMGGEQIINDFAPSGIEYPLAVRLSGRFKTAFPNGKPKAPDPAADADKADADESEEEKAAEKKEGEAAEPGLKEGTGENVVLLIGDCDMIQDQVAVTEAMNPFGGQRMVMPANGNLAFAQGAIEQLTGDNSLIAVRSRASRERPFTVVKEMQSDAEARYRSKIKELEGSLAETQRRLNELQQTRQQEGGQRFILSPEQQEEIANFRKKEAEAKQQLKQERKKLRTDIDSLENRIKWANIAGMPAVVALVGVILAIVRRSRRAAR